MYKLTKIDPNVENWIFFKTFFKNWLGIHDFIAKIRFRKNVNW